MTARTSTSRPGWTLAIVSIALFMTALDNLVVGVALPSIRVDLGGSIESLEWTVNAYTLTFAVLLITGAALGDRFGRKRMFVIGLGIFTIASALAALAPSIESLIAARALQGLGAAIVLPLTLTLLSEAVPSERRGMALGIWAGVSGLGVALGPFVGGAVVEGIAWQWIFWLNVPIGLVLLPLAARRLTESHGPSQKLDLPGLGLAGAGLFGLTFGIVRATALGWTSATVVTSIGAGVVLLATFLWWETRASAPMLPLRFFRSRGFAASNGVSFAMFFGVFGSIFLLSQFFQTAQGYSPFEAGLRTLPWTGMPMLIAPIAGLLSDRIGSRPLMVAGPRAAVDRAVLAGDDLVAGHRLREPDRAVRDRRHRHGARLRAVGQRRPRRRPARGGRSGVGRDERDPRARRRDGRRGARDGVQRARLVRHAAGVQRRRRGRAADRRRGARPRRGDRAVRAGAAAPGQRAIRRITVDVARVVRRIRLTYAAPGASAVLHSVTSTPAGARCGSRGARWRG